MKLPIPYRKSSPATRRMAREQYIREQKEKCYHCKGYIHHPPVGPSAKLTVNGSLFPPGFFNYPIHLHHDHKTDMTIGAVHAHCNAVLWQYHGE